MFKNRIMNIRDTTESKFECKVADLSCFVTVTIDYNFYYREAKGFDPAEEELTIIKDKINYVAYYIEGEEVSKQIANKYYNRYCEANIDQVIDINLDEFVQTHIDIKKEDIAYSHLQD
jgi:hypothetical protein